MRIQLSDHFSYGNLIRFVFPSVVMMIFTSIYGVVDGLFVSNLVGKTAFAAVNFVMPFLMGLGALGFMFGAGGSALVAKTLGEQDRDRANRYFSMMVCVSILVGIVLLVLGQLVLRPVIIAMGVTEGMLNDCLTYGRIQLISTPAFMLQYLFQSFFATAEKPKLGLAVMVLSGCTNMGLDALFIMGFKWGIAGAAIATTASELVGGIVPLIYFLRRNDSLLRIVKPHFQGRVLMKACINGSSEFMTNISMSVVNVLYNYQLLRFAGEDGVAAYGVIMYVNFIFTAVFIGYSMGSAPIIGYNYGAENHSELKNLFKKSLKMIGICGVVMFIAGQTAAPLLSGIFVGYDDSLYEMTCRAFRIYSISFLIVGFNIFGSNLFTALNNGLISATISFMRTLLFQVIAVLVLPIFLKIDGIWLGITVAELMAVMVTISFFAKYRNRYHYI